MGRSKELAKLATAYDSGGALSFRNKIINGNFAINQRGVSGTVTLAAGAYGHDRWKAGASGCAYTFSASGGVITLNITAGSLQQVIEDVNVPIGANTCVMSWSGTAQGKIGAGSYGASGVTASVTGGSHLTVEFGTGTLSKVQFEAGVVPTSYEQRPHGFELLLCQRYFFNFLGGAAGFANGTSIVEAAITYPVEMRAAPVAAATGNVQSVNWLGGIANPSSANVSTLYAGLRGATLRFNNYSGLTSGQGVVLQGQVATATFNAEL